MMPTALLDPAPRDYPSFVTLRRRSAAGPASVPAGITMADVTAWLLGPALAVDDQLALFEGLCWRLVSAGLPLDRASLHVGTLHPQLFGFAWNWVRADGFCDEVKVADSVLGSDSYRLNPLYRVVVLGETVHVDLSDPAGARSSPLMAELAEQGMSEYLALPLSAGSYHNAMTVTTAQPGGFTAADRAALDGLFKLFALHVGRHIALTIARNVLDTYLGPAAGARVLHGSIRRGAGEALRAVVWVSDLRGFTDLADRLPGPQVLAILNAYFERLAGAVMAHGGEVLKFIGDGLLAVFPHEAFADEAAAATAALDAAEQAVAALQALDQAPPAELAGIAGWRPLRTGIALHDGTVFFGNVGAPERLDFTVIGTAVNTAARVEALTKQFGRSIIVTGPVARLVDRPLDHLGDHSLRGVAAPVALFSPRAPSP